MNAAHFNLAVNMAKKSASRFRLGAVLAYKRRVISTGFNDMSRTHPLMKRYSREKNFDLGLHAEVHSCIGVSADDLYGSELYVARILKNGSAAMARPCMVCQKFLLDVGIKSVYYTTDTGYGEL